MKLFRHTTRPGLFVAAVVLFSAGLSGGRLCPAQTLLWSKPEIAVGGSSSPDYPVTVDARYGPLPSEALSSTDYFEQSVPEPAADSAADSAAAADDGQYDLFDLPLAPLEDESDRLFRNYQRTYTLEPHPCLDLPYEWFDCTRTRLDGCARGYYFNDQRIEWSGQEATFGVEGSLSGIAVTQQGDWDFGCEMEFYLNQPYDRNILVDTPERASYRGNFEYDPFEISQMTFSMRRGDFLAAIGRFVTPFGRTYFPLYTNDLSDAPFIRTESILWRETGALLQYAPGSLVVTAAVTNGGWGRDSNSSKALVSRVGIERERFACGASVKWQDGIGSEGQKQYNNHAGIDAMLKLGRLVFSSEVIYDEYGFHRPFDPLEITWGRSIYYRDRNQAFKDPITGVGYYMNLDYCLPSCTLTFNYGEYYPEAIGDPLHDETNRRGFIKGAYHFCRRADFYAMYLRENDLPNAQAGRTRGGTYVLTGFQYRL